MWVPAEVKDPILLHAPTRKSVGYFGAVRLRDGKLLTKREEKVFDAETFWRFLKLLRQVSSRSGRRVAVISDNAKYHHALLHREWRQQLEPRFALHFLLETICCGIAFPGDRRAGSPSRPFWAGSSEICP
jgi:DDE superfamily endonuclease